MLLKIAKSGTIAVWLSDHYLNILHEENIT